MAACTEVFEEWLVAKLKSLNIDHDVFGGYIKGIVEGSDTKEEKMEALNDILVGISEEVMPLCDEILNSWATSQIAEKSRKKDECDSNNIDAKLATIMDQQAQCVLPVKNHSKEEKLYRDTILAQYSQISDNDEEDFADDPGGDEGTSAAAAASGKSDKLMVRNMNAESVLKAEKDKREKAKAEVEKKKALDKAGREKQKQQQQDRKEKEKKRTQKVEKRR